MNNLISKIIKIVFKKKKNKLPEKKYKRIIKSIELHGSSDSLEQERRFVERTLHDAGISQEILPLIVLACDEACANVVGHFYENDPKKKYVITISISDKKIIIIIESYGKEIKIKRSENVDLEKHFKNGKTHGLGKYFMNTLMDEVTYHYIEKMNVVKLVKYI